MIEAQDRETAAAIRIALYRAVPDMPSYAAGIIEPYLERHRQQAEEAMRERIAVICDYHVGKFADAENAGNDEAEEAWHGGMAHAARRLASAIRGIDAGGEG